MWVEWCAAYSPLTAVVVVNAKDLETIYAYNADQKTQPASLVKMMTLLLTFKALKSKKTTLNAKVKISNNAASQSPTKLGLKTSETISVRDAILALIVKSANDIAVAIAEHLETSEGRFVAAMNREALRLGMCSTVFYNASGRNDPRQLTTARDMAKLARTLLLEYPEYYHLFSNKQFFLGDRRIRGHYALLGKQGDIIVDGIKTGYLNACGFNLAASAKKGNERVISIVLGCKTSGKREAWTKFLLKKSFAKLQRKKLMGRTVRPKKDQESARVVTGIYKKMNTLEGGVHDG
ncbi:MAG: D-alanyl-D-alanine carboxypeptidase [Holosporaceae bacterium]|jgi:D-alanyl-D-alanine carboxypeptidase|nr:D-alanyl-D-alanine carboxypeptidase [Holosporaceae bacterium]